MALPKTSIAVVRAIRTEDGFLELAHSLTRWVGVSKDKLLTKRGAAGFTINGVDSGDWRGQASTAEEDDRRVKHESRVEISPLLYSYDHGIA
ncbi:unnamed protein product, partial [Linum tenue]